jgi:hypothetical protein
MGQGIAIGIGVAILAPLALAIMAGHGRPLARAAVKTGLIFVEKGKETFAEVGEVVEDLVAEARAELEEAGLAEPAGGPSVNEDLAEQAEPDTDAA